MALGLLATAPPLPRCEAQAPEGKDAPKDGGFQRDLITQYRFSERYGTGVGMSADGAIGQYKVGILMTRGHGGEQAGLDARARAQDPKSLTQNLVYVERASEVSSLGQVKSLVRRYEKVEITADGEPIKSAVDSIEGLTIWYHPQLEETPQVISLSEGRRLREQHYVFVASQVFVPTLAGLLPSIPVRIGDAWQLSRLGVRGLVAGEKVLEGGLRATLTDIMPDPSSNAGGLLAVIDVEGHTRIREGFLTNTIGATAKIKFAFTPKRAMRAALAVNKNDAVVDARGAIVRLDLALKGTTVSEADRSAKPRPFHREFTVERQLANTGQPLEVPREPPKMTEQNSWLTYVDHDNKFSFRHPQDLHHPREYGNVSNEGPNRVELVHLRPAAGIDHITVDVKPGAQQDPKPVCKTFLEELKKIGGDVLEGASDWLPEIQWPGMKAYRCEAAMVNRDRAARGANRVHIDEYVVQVRKKGSLVARAITSQDPPTQFRNDVEDMLRTFKWGPPED